MPFAWLAARLAPRAMLAGGLAAMLLAGLWWVDHRAFRSGRAACEASAESARLALQERLHAAAEEAGRRAAEVEAERAARAEDARRLEDALRETSGDRCLPDAGSLRRIEEHWRARPGGAASADGRRPLPRP